MNTTCACMEILRGVADSMGRNPTVGFVTALNRELLLQSPDKNTEITLLILGAITASKPYALSDAVLLSLVRDQLPERVAVTRETIEPVLVGMERLGVITIERGPVLWWLKRVHNGAGRKEAA